MEVTYNLSPEAIHEKSQYLELGEFLMAWNDDLVRQGIY